MVRSHVQFTFLCSLFIFSCSTKATMSVNRMVVYFEAGQLPRQDIQITNPDNETLYLETEVFKVINPGATDETLKKITETDQIKLLATPQKAVIPANTYKSIRLISLETPPNLEQVYRVTFRPVLGDMKATRSAIKVLVAYQALVFIRPAKTRKEVTPAREKNTVVFKNTGNINVVLRNTHFCKRNENRDCSPLKQSGRIYPGQAFHLTLPEEAIRLGGSIRYGLFDGQDEVSKVFRLNSGAQPSRVKKVSTNQHEQ
ncbi:fimbria/pilus periplasmic chaperone [Parendozoicomonas sp. Alg238-R29]|uniref:fimbrial biogenesis chaperone n=1 Tax=Parendozoicomonas sp. Alg238-R29 TaxID=2993446 RepID=UPI00248DD1C8|nr:fimbria/pilus periplasmic chaperone [Parendozoicomonas sp. Alg238-R29]